MNKSTRFITAVFSLGISFGITHMAFAASAETVHVRIQTPTEEVFSDWISVPDGCSLKDTDGVKHTLTDFVAVCALDAFSEQENVSLDVQNSSYGLYLSGIGSDLEDSTQSWYWMYRVNNISPSVGLDSYVLADGDELLVTLGVWPSSPVAMSLSNVDIVKGDSVTITVTAFDDTTQSFEILPEATVYVGKSKYKTYTADAKGEVKVPLEKTGDFNVFASKKDYATSEVSHVRVRKANESSEFVGRQERQRLLTSALNWLTSQIDSKGKIESIGITEWAAMAFARAGEAAPETMQSAITHYDPDASSATDLERHILALLAVNGDPRDQGGENYIQQLYNQQVHDKQVGDEAYLNDDIFGLLAFLKSGQPVNSLELKQITRFIQDHQLSDGSFSYSTSLDSGDSDTTAAAIRALQLAQHKGSVVPLEKTITAAKHFLESTQRLDGGFAYDAMTIDSNSASTAWVALALHTPGNWKINKRQPWTYISWAAQGNGSFAWLVGYSGDALTTAYVAEALAASLP